MSEYIDILLFGSGWFLGQLCYYGLWPKISYAVRYRNGWYTTPDYSLDRWFKKLNISNNAYHLRMGEEDE